MHLFFFEPHKICNLCSVNFTIDRMREFAVDGDFVNVSGHVVMLDHADSMTPPHISGCGAVVWDCAIVLSHFLTMPLGRSILSGKNVLELGAGTGLCGLTAARCG